MFCKLYSYFYVKKKMKKKIYTYNDFFLQCKKERKTIFQRYFLTKHLGVKYFQNEIQTYFEERMK